MDLNHIAFWTAGLPAAMLFWRGVKRWPEQSGWLAASGLVLSSLALGWFLFRADAGYVAASLALLLIFIPTWANNAALRASERQAYGRAHQLARLAALLHPADAWPTKPRLFLAFQFAQAGQLADAETLLGSLEKRGGELGSVAHVHRLRLFGRWRELIAYAEQRGLLALHTEPGLLMSYLRALGELGRIPEMARFMRAHAHELAAAGIDEAACLYLFAFAGQTELTDRILTSAGRTYGPDMREFWRAVAAEHAGDHDGARRLFKHLGQSRDAQARARAGDRLEHLQRAAPEEPPSAETLATVRYFAGIVGSGRRFQLNAPFRSVVTLALVAINVAVFVLGQWRLDDESTNEQVERFGLFVPDLVSGQWWRALTYLFEHAGFVHLAMNMGALWFLGPFVERAFGRVRFLLIYFVSGTCGTLAYVFIWALHRVPDAKLDHLVGASGCIMGVLGAIAAFMLRAWRAERAPVAGQMLLQLLLIVVVEAAFDATSRDISLLAHGLGLLGGFVCALLLQDRLLAQRGLLPTP